MARLLVCEDDDAIAEPLVRSLARDGHAVDLAVTGEAALSAIAAATPDLLILDIGLPGIDGIEVCRVARRSHPELAILMLTARSSELDEVLGLDSGADDYVTKPFQLSVLLARVRVLLRRERSASRLEACGVRVDPGARRAWRDERELELSPKEFDLLALLLASAGRVLRRDRIMREVWDENWWGSTKTLDVHMATLRRKLGAPCPITTVRGVGFRFEAG